MYTIGQVAAMLGVPVHRVDYAVSSRRIDGHARAGRYRMFSSEQITAIAEALRETGALPDSRVLRPAGECR